MSSQRALFVLILSAGILSSPIHGQTIAQDSPVVAMNGFAHSMAVGEGEFFVGEPLNERTSGAVYVYEPDQNGVWVEAARLVASDGKEGDRFGSAVAFDGTSLVVTATRADSGRGAAYVFVKNTFGQWEESARLAPEQLTNEDRFGAAVDIDGRTILVGADESDSGKGAVYVFRQHVESDEWLQGARLTGSDSTGRARFGSSLAVSGEEALVGAPGEDTGVVYRYRLDESTGEWTANGTLAGTGMELDRTASRQGEFGYRIELQGDIAVISAPFLDEMTGAVFVFRRDSDSGDWSEGVRLQPFDPAPRTLFGFALLKSGTDIWVGAPGASGFSGAAYVLKWNDDREAWDSADRIVTDSADSQDFFAGAMSGYGDLVVVGLPRDDYGAGTAVVYQRDNATGAWNERQKVFSVVEGMEAITGEQLDCDSGKAGGFDCSHVDLLSFIPLKELGGGRGVQLNDVWGWTDPETGREYALVGRVDGTSFVDISDPLHPVLVGNLPKTEGVPGNVWRDIKVYNDHAFIVADGSAHHGMQVFDLRQLRDVQSPPVEFQQTAHYDKIHSAHNIVINEESGFAYSVGSSSGGETCGGGLHMINIQDPAQPTFAGCFADPTTGRRNTGYTHDAQCVIYRGPDADHSGREICFGANETALSIADVTDKANPIAVSATGYPNPGYTHQGWLTEDHRYFFVNDELDEINGYTDGTRTLVWDVADLDDPQLAAEHVSDNKASDHNLYVQGNTLFQSNYESGLRVLDIADPTNPKEIGYFDTVPYGTDRPGFAGSWSNYPFFQSGVIVVTSSEEGLFLLKKQEVGI